MSSVRKIRQALLTLAGLVLGAAIGVPATRAQTLPDPTRPPPSVTLAPKPAGDPASIAEREEPGRFDLQAIFLAEGRRVAIINGRRVRERDPVGPMHVARIARGRVVLRRGDESLELHLVGRDVKSSRKDQTASDDASQPMHPAPPETPEFVTTELGVPASAAPAPGGAPR